MNPIATVLHPVVLVLAATLTLPIRAALAEEEVESASAWQVAAGTSATLPLLRGGGLEIAVQSPSRLRLVASAFTLRLPEAFHGDNKDEDWTRRDIGGGIAAQLFLRRDGAGFFLGGEIQLQVLRYRRAGEEIDVFETDLTAQLGYHWRPLGERGLYVTPRLLAIIPIYESEEAEIAGETFDEPLPLRVVPALYAGWEF
jgi:hypothetical protein